MNADDSDQVPERVRCLRSRKYGAIGGERGGTIAREEYLAAHKKYLRAFRTRANFRLLSAARLAELGGFGYDAITELLGREPKTWIEDPPEEEPQLPPEDS